MTHPLFHSRDYYCSAYMHLLGVPLLYTRIVDGRATFTFDNADERAYHAFLDFQADNGNDLVPLKQFRTSYRHIQDEARRAKEEDTHHDHDNAK